MATLSGNLYADNITLRRAEPDSALDVTLNYGKLRYISDAYTIPTADELGTSAVVYFFKIPKGARVLEMFLTAPQDGTSNTGQMDIGWLDSEEEDENGDALEAADADGFYAAADADFGGAALARKAMAATAAGYRKKFDAEVQVVGDVAEATSDSGGNEILLEAYIVVE